MWLELGFEYETEGSRSDRVGGAMVMEVYQLWLVGLKTRREIRFRLSSFQLLMTEILPRRMEILIVGI